MHWLKTGTIAFVLGLLLTGSASSQIPVRATPSKDAAAATSLSPTEDQLGRSTPYGTVTGFLSAAERDDFVRAAKYLGSQQSPERKQELARQLKLVLDQTVRVDLNRLSRTPEGGINDDLEPNRESVGVATNGSDRLDIVLERVENGKQPKVWLFSSQTLSSIPDFAQGLGASWIEGLLPKGLVERRFFGVPLYRFISLPVSVLLGFTLACMLVWILSLVFRVWLRGSITRYGLRARGFVGPLRLLVFTLLMQIGSRVAPTLVARLFWKHVVTLLTIVGVAWLLMRALEVSSHAIARRMRAANAPGRVAIVHLLRSVGNALIVAIGILVILAVEGVDTTAVLTGLGVGGIAIAFAAQKTIENLFGTVTIVSDQPIRIGDRCKINGDIGTVEQIGLRSTRIRTLDRSVVTVPNGQLANISLENFTLRDKFRCHHIIGLRFGTTADQLRFVTREIQRLLYEHPKVESGSARVRLVRFGKSSLDLDMRAFILASDKTAFLEIQEDLLLRIMEAIEASGTSIALPSHLMYLRKDVRLHAQTVQAGMAGLWKQQTK